ncbi:MAG: tRNA uridine-5-carboxymethylaminomethyl(34) synthesis enzyme MnmG [Rickettsiales bacterium]|jgi:tRNA uridine 5-carboxymethylaminomethyl modification enzyme|nr:tRNA uridine-5-carboxymethylaminomethyl(34) synthesis enzyme MnmG [Rickettsiales bacterium]
MAEWDDFNLPISDTEHMTNYDLIIIGGGHAGVEAAAAAARRGARTLMLTRSESDLGAMSCNPSIGGPGKSQMVAEMDALGGIMPVAADMAGIHWRLLNATHGAATRALRAQIDRRLYRIAVKRLITNNEQLTTIFEPVETLDLENKIVNGKYRGGAIVITTGTFLRGLVHRGREKRESGRLQDDGTYQAPDKNISKILEKAGFSLLRLKTGTPARLRRDSINFDVCEPQPGDEEHEWFSGNRKSEFPASNFQIPISCFITHTNEQTHQIIRDNISTAPMYNGDITGTGPRYCPSLEDKVMRFPEHRAHHVFLEPEGLDSDLIYPNGISTSMSAELQDKWLRTIPGLENVSVARYGYAIEYDAIDARALKPTLESKDIPGLFFAGQINGTSGYEEAAAQGLVAGANAAAYALGTHALNLDRTNSMIGVMIDDITTLGVDEPYRMFTSRAEYRLSLRADNAVFRLGETAVELGLLSRPEFDRKSQERRAKSEENDKFYAGYIARNSREIEAYRRDAELRIPADFDYAGLPGLTNELIEKSTRARPANIAALSRIPGMTPAAIITVMRKIKN